VSRLRTYPIARVVRCSLLGIMAMDRHPWVNSGRPAGMSGTGDANSPVTHVPKNGANAPEESRLAETAGGNQRFQQADGCGDTLEPS
jgi:hypothetical protein